MFSCKKKTHKNPVQDLYVPSFVQQILPSIFPEAITSKLIGFIFRGSLKVKHVIELCHFISFNLERYYEFNSFFLMFSIVLGHQMNPAGHLFLF